MGFPGGSGGKESTFNAGDLGSIPGLGQSPGGGRGNPLQYSCLENPHGQRSLVGYSPWGRKESDKAELLSTAQHSISRGAETQEQNCWDFPGDSGGKENCLQCGRLSFDPWV